MLCSLIFWSLAELFKLPLFLFLKILEFLISCGLSKLLISSQSNDDKDCRCLLSKLSLCYYLSIIFFHLCPRHGDQEPQTYSRLLGINVSWPMARANLPHLTLCHSFCPSLFFFWDESHSVAQGGVRCCDLGCRNLTSWVQFFCLQSPE